MVILPKSGGSKTTYTVSYNKNTVMATKYTAFRCPEDLLAKAKVKAEGERRSLSNYIVCLIEKDTAGMPPAQKPPKAKKSKD